MIPFAIVSSNDSIDVWSRFDWQNIVGMKNWSTSCRCIITPPVKHKLLQLWSSAEEIPGRRYHFLNVALLNFRIEVSRFHCHWRFFSARRIFFLQVWLSLSEKRESERFNLNLRIDNDCLNDRFAKWWKFCLASFPDPIRNGSKPEEICMKSVSTVLIIRLKSVNELDQRSNDFANKPLVDFYLCQANPTFVCFQLQFGHRRESARKKYVNSF